jgi:hypothetical protein
VEDSDNALFTRQTFFVFFGGDEVSEALAGHVLDFCLLSPLALLIGLDFLGWWHPLDTLSCSHCFLIIVMRLSTLGLVGATFSCCTQLEIFLSTIRTCEHCSTFGLKVNRTSSLLMLRQISPAPILMLALAVLKKGL